MIEKVRLNQVCGFEDVKDYYFVVRDGDECWVEGLKGKVISGSFDKEGYRALCLQLNYGKQKFFYQHRIFMIVFTPNPENKSDVNHKDGVKTNNLLSNLDWTTSSENRQHACDTGLAKPKLGDQNGNSKLKNSEIPLIFEMRKTGMNQQSIGDHFGVSQAQIHRVLRGKSRSQS